MDKIKITVARYKPNGYGLHDMIGNVMEWVDDCWFEQHDENNKSGHSSSWRDLH